MAQQVWPQASSGSGAKMRRRVELLAQMEALHVMRSFPRHDAHTQARGH